MRTFVNSAAQGELYFTRIDILPVGLIQVEPDETGHVVVGHSETGHHHVMDAETVQMYRLPEELYECFLKVDSATMLNHLRDYDTHEPLQFEPGNYRVRLGREAIPEGWRQTID